MDIKRKTAIYVEYVDKISSEFMKFKREVRKLELMSHLGERDANVIRCLRKINELADSLYGQVSNIPNL